MCMLFQEEMQGRVAEIRRQQVGLVQQEQGMSQRPWRADQLCCAMLNVCVKVT